MSFKRVSGLGNRIQAVIHGAVGALPRELRNHPAARLNTTTLDRLTTTMTAWTRAAGTDMASFAERFFGRAADDPIAGKLWAAATMAERARSHAELGVAATDLDDAQQLVGLDRWLWFVADAEQRAGNIFADFTSHPPNLSGPPVRLPGETADGARGPQ